MRHHLKFGNPYRPNPDDAVYDETLGWVTYQELWDRSSSGMENAPSQTTHSKSGEVRIAIVGLDNHGQPTLSVGVVEKRHNDFLKFAGGSVEKDEAVFDAAKREVVQETGLNLTNEDIELICVEEKKKWLRDGSYVTHPLHFFVALVPADRLRWKDAGGSLERETEETVPYVQFFTGEFFERPGFYDKHDHLRKKLADHFGVNVK
ncbi:MAG TPA: NUDIX hydrolase [Candidatus Paceibacterota bacterium]